MPQTWVFVRFVSAHATECIKRAVGKDRCDMEGTHGKKLEKTWVKLCD